MKNKTKNARKNSTGISIVRPLLILLFVGFFLFVGGQKACQWVKRSSYFKVTRVSCSATLRAKELERFLYLKDQNIFDVDLAQVQRRLEQSFPEIGEIRVFKRFPNEIHIALKERSPYAVLGLGPSRVLIDRQGFVIAKDAPSSGSFPLIYGLPSPSQNILLGQKIVNDHLKVGLALLEYFAASKALRSFAIMKADVRNLSRIPFFLGEQLEVVIDQDDMKAKINTLALILEKAKLDWERIRYIDLRFREPVIKYDQ